MLRPCCRKVRSCYKKKGLSCTVLWNAKAMLSREKAMLWSAIECYEHTSGHYVTILIHYIIKDPCYGVMALYSAWEHSIPGPRFADVLDVGSVIRYLLLKTNAIHFLILLGRRFGHSLLVT